MIIHGFYPLVGGAEVAAYNLAKNLIKKGYKIKVTTSNLQRYAEYQLIDDIEIIRIPCRKRNLAAFTQYEMAHFFINSLSPLYQLVRKFKPDVIHAHFTVPAGLLAYLIKRLTKVPYIVTFHGSDVPRYNIKKYSITYALLTPIIKSIWRNANYLISVSENLKQYVTSIMPSLLVQVINNGVDLDEFHPRMMKHNNSDPIKIIMVGRLIELKGFQYVIQSIPDVIRKSPKRVIVDVIGEGEKKEELINLTNRLGISQNVNFLGFLDRKELAKKYREASIFVIPSLNEAFPVALLEAMASGLPIIGSKVGGIKEIVKEGVNGFLTESKNIHRFSDCLMKLINDDELRYEFGQKSVELSKSWDWKLITMQYEDIYQKVSRSFLRC